MQHRTPLAKKYKAVRLLAAFRRSWGDRFVPKFREVARELGLKPQVLPTIWENREAIEERAKRRLPGEQGRI